MNIQLFKEFSPTFAQTPVAVYRQNGISSFMALLFLQTMRVFVAVLKLCGLEMRSEGKAGTSFDVPATPSAKRRTNLPSKLLRRPPAIELADPVPLQRMRGFTVPDDPGVYLIHDLRGVLYAGRSICLRRRFTEHCEARGNELIALAQRSVFGRLTFSWTFVPDARRRAQLERDLISWLQPPCNRTLPGVLR